MDTNRQQDDQLDQRVLRGRARAQELLEVLRHSAAGMSVAAIAERLACSQHRVVSLQRVLDLL
jgi:hypothetical protein